MANILISKLDSYTIRARVQPVLLAILPIAVVATIWLGNQYAEIGVLIGLVTSAGGAGFLAQVSRDLGRRKQGSLYQEWGGPPSTQKLRFQECTNKELLIRRHTRIAGIMGESLPTEMEEQRNPREADLKYESAVEYLLEATRDRTRFHLVFEENINYGLRRNLLGLKPIGIAVAVPGVLVAWAMFSVEMWSGGNGFSIGTRLLNAVDLRLVQWLIGALFNSLLLATWIFVISPGWVKTAADRYAERLIGAIDSIG